MSYTHSSDIWQSQGNERVADIAITCTKYIKSTYHNTHTHTQSTEIHSHTTKYYENHWIFYYYLLIQFNREYDDVK